jgi:hypothetical protein
MRVRLGPKFSGEATQRLIRAKSDYMVHMWVMAEERSVGELGKYRDASRGMAAPDSTEKRGGQEHVADRAEPDGQNV